MEVRVHLEEGIAIGVNRRDRRAKNPFVASLNLRSKLRHLCGDSRSKRMSLLGTKRITKDIFHVFRRNQSASIGVHGRQFEVVTEFLAISNTCAPTAGRTAIVGKTSGQVILEEVSCR